MGVHRCDSPPGALCLVAGNELFLRCDILRQIATSRDVRFGRTSLNNCVKLCHFVSSPTADHEWVHCLPGVRTQRNVSLGPHSIIREFGGSNLCR